ncbi:hypothetical protein D3C73_1178830 [compost metagenome]
MQRVAIRIHVIGQYALRDVGDLDGRIFVSIGLVVISLGQRIGDIPLEGLRRRRASQIGCRDRDRVHAGAAKLRGGMIDLAADDAGVRINRQASRQAGGAEGELVARTCVRVREVARYIQANDRLRILAALVGDRGGGRA